MTLDINTARNQATLLHGSDAVKTALDRMAQAITTRLATTNPIVLCVMNGGLMPTAWLLERLDFPLQLDYVHASRYRGNTQGDKELSWRAKPQLPLQGRTVLLIDDILDEGLTLLGIVDWCKQQNADTVFTAVLTEKKHDRNKTGLTADFVGLEIPDRYVFGCGLDYQHYWRNLPAIYALSEENRETRDAKKP